MGDGNDRTRAVLVRMTPREYDYLAEAFAKSSAAADTPPGLLRFSAGGLLRAVGLEWARRVLGERLEADEPEG